MTWKTSAIVPPATWVNIMMTWQPLLTRNSPSQAYAYFKNYWDVYRPRRGAPSTGRKEVQVSAGFGAILFAMHVCGKVSIYNFRQGVGHYYKKPRERSQKRHRFSTRHHWNYEKRCMKILADGHLPGVKVKG